MASSFGSGRFKDSRNRACSGTGRGPSSQRETINTGATVPFEYRAGMLTRDENIVNVSLVVQFRRTDPQTFIFNVRDPEATLEAATASAIREVVGRNMLDFILTEGRTEVSAQTQDLLQATLDAYGTGITIYEVNLVGAEFPSEVEVAVQDSIRAREDRERRILEAQTYSNDILPRARGEAERRRQEAEAYREQVVADAEGESDRFTQVLAEYEKAPGVTRERIYIETLEEILSTSTKCSSIRKAATTCCTCRSTSSSAPARAPCPPTRRPLAFPQRRRRAPAPTVHATGATDAIAETTHELTHQFPSDRRGFGGGRDSDGRVHGRCAPARREVPDGAHRSIGVCTRSALQASVLRERRPVIRIAC